jgi:hypothetical protein
VSDPEQAAAPDGSTVGDRARLQGHRLYP